MMLIIKLIFTAFSAAISTVKASQLSLLRTARSLQAPENCDTCYNQTSGAGNTYEFYPQWLNGSRDYVYCEMIWNYNDTYGSDLFSTSPIKPCNTTWWDDLNLDDVAALYNASSATKNGPQSWSMDYVRVYASDPQDILGEPMVYGAVLPGGTASTPPYTVFYPTKNQYLVWDAGKPTYQLTDTDDYHYVLQGYKVPKDSLDTLGEQMQDLPDGWSYDVVTITDDLVFDLTPDAPIPSVQDEFDQIYIRIPAGDNSTTTPTSSAIIKSEVLSMFVLGTLGTWFIM